MALAERLLPFENAVLHYCANPSDEDALNAARQALVALLGQLADSPAPHWAIVPDLIEQGAKSPADKHLLAVVLLRALSARRTLPENSADNHLDRRIVEAIKSGASDLFSRYVQGEKLQTYQQVDKLAAAHKDMTARLDLLSNTPATIDALLGLKNDIFKVLNQKQFVSYLAPFGAKEMVYNITAIFQSIETLRSTLDRSFSDRLDSLRSIVDKQILWTAEKKTFLTQDYYVKFLKSIEAALHALDQESRLRFLCQLGAKTPSTLVLEKRYPLEALRITTVTIPLHNAGPGVALDVAARFRAHNTAVEFSNPEINIGDISPGDFAVATDLMLGSASKEAEFDLLLEWSTLASPERQTSTVRVRILAQSSSINWTKLEKEDPYTTAIAEGKDFIGRRDKLAALSGRLLKERMQSSYITGQKRVGKSSLGLAVRDLIESNPDTSTVRFLYLEYGAYAHVDPANTLMALGGLIWDFLIAYLPGPPPTTPPSFVGTLAPLSRLADQLLKAVPDKKFVVILDEFDEIPPELYRMGPLAETFFANLRTLSGKKNIAFMLIGGENMPFIVSAQGDQLNKFVRESLNYFSRTDDWGDYIQLVTAPVAETLRWHDSAISKLFALTNGHPYYTKLICSRVYNTAVSEKDADITVTEVQRSYDRLISILDTNSFAHLWKDGIQGTREEVEVIALQRCRLLVALGRLLRRNAKLTLEAIKINKYSTGLPDHRIAPILTDLCHRGILDEIDGEYTFILPLFRDWIAQSGINRLIADTLGDELAASEEKAEDDAFVQDGEITELVDTWPPYRGRPTTVQDVRQWLGQVPKFREQRSLFTLLKHVRFFSEAEVREKLRLAHSLVLRSVPGFVRRSPADRRQDIIVTYVDGTAKSGHYYAARYAEENLLASSCVKEMNDFAETLRQHEEQSEQSVNGLVIVDDILGSGRSLSGNLTTFLEKHREALSVRNVYIVVVVLCATPEGESHLRKTLTQIEGLKVDLRVCEPLSPNHFAFGPGKGFWESQDAEDQAKALCLQIGAGISKQAPLGFAGQGLLVVFPQTCPNNSLPLLHATRSSRDAWQGLFPRPKN